MGLILDEHAMIGTGLHFRWSRNNFGPEPTDDVSEVSLWELIF